jgi:hypothetical protein
MDSLLFLGVLLLQNQSDIIPCPYALKASAVVSGFWLLADGQLIQ